MPVDFLTAEQKIRYGKFSTPPDEEQLARYFHLDKTDLELVSQCRGNQNRLGFALQLTCLRFLGTFLVNFEAIPTNVLEFLAAQLEIESTDVFKAYSAREPTKREHAAAIRRYYGYHEFRFPWTFRLIRLLYTRSWLNNERPSLLFDFATSWLIQHKVLLPGVTTLARLVAEVRERASNRLWKQLSSLPTNEQKDQLETLLQVKSGERVSLFDRYRKGAVTISSVAFNEAVKRFKALKAFGLQSLDFSHIPPVRLKSLARYASMTSAYKIARMPNERRIALLLAFVKSFEIFALDEALDILDLLITRISGEAKRIGQKKRLRTLKDLDQSALALADVCALILNEKTCDSQIRKMIFSRIPKEKIKESVTMIQELARPLDHDFQEEMIEQYGRIQRILPKLFDHIVFKAAPAGKTILEAFHYLSSINLSRKQTLPNCPLEIITRPWKHLVFNKKAITKRGYVLCFLDRLQDALRRRDVYVEHSDRWGDTREKLLQGAEWQAHRLQVYRSLGHPLDPKEAIDSLSHQMEGAYNYVANRFEENDAISLDLSGKSPSLTITNLDKLEESPRLMQLNNTINKLIPKVDLTELLLEIHAHTGFADEFTHVSESNARAEDLPISICAVLMAEACNIGLEPLLKHYVPALTRHRLNWVKQNYLREETLVRANARLVDYQTKLALAKKWGGGEVASSDGLRFTTPIKTINAGLNKKYFGANRGITWYNFVSDQYTGFHGIVIPGTLRDSIFVLEGLLEQQTSLSPKEIMTDTAGTSDMVFGLFWLLGYQFSPRLADAGEAIFWRINKKSDYKALNKLARGCINTKKIEQHWDDMIRIAGSLKMGTVQASELIRSLLKSDRPSSLAQAIIEAGRINKTLYLLSYIDDEDYRRRILTQLNRGEGRHRVARAICHGQRGEIRKRYREGQEDQLGSLGLVTNAVVLWNTIYIQEALNHLNQQSIEIQEEDKIHLSPLAYRHINMLGHYSFTLSENIMNGELRPLNQASGEGEIP